jgi:hypothetical protein
MPYEIKRLKNGKYRVKNKDTGAIKARGTTKAKAEKQVRFLRYIEHKK